jgi:hypothetical protein
VKEAIQAHEPELQNALSSMHVSSDAGQFSPINLPSEKISKITLNQ